MVDFNSLCFRKAFATVDIQRQSTDLENHIDFCFWYLPFLRYFLRCMMHFHANTEFLMMRLHARLDCSEAVLSKNAGASQFGGWWSQVRITHMAK